MDISEYSKKSLSITNVIMNAINYDGEDVTFSEYLEQALTRPSASHKYGLLYNNEVLEFYGDSVLNSIVSIEMAKHYSIKQVYAIPLIDEMNDLMYNSRYQEGELSKIRSSIVCKDNLAKRCDELDITKYIICADSDLDNNGYPTKSCKEDTFEAIIGAVLIDSGYDLAKVRDVVVTMLGLEAFFKNDEGFVDVEKVVNDYYKAVYKELPDIEISELEDGEFMATSYYLPNGAFGKTKKEARKLLYLELYNDIEVNNRFCSLEMIVGGFDYEKCIQQVKILTDKKIFNSKYYFKKSIKDNNDSWECLLLIEYDINSIINKSNTKNIKLMAIKTSKKSKQDAKRSLSMAVLEKFDYIYCQLKKAHQDKHLNRFIDKYDLEAKELLKEMEEDHE